MILVNHTHLLFDVGGIRQRSVVGSVEQSPAYPQTTKLEYQTRHAIFLGGE